MSLHRENAKRDKNEKEIVEFLRQIGAFVTQLNQEGVPDLLVLYQDEVYFFEVKNKHGKLTPAQEKWHLEAGKRGASVWIVKSVEDVVRVLNLEL